MTARQLRALVALVGLGAGRHAALSQDVHGASDPLRGLPLREVSASPDRGRVLAVVVTGDGGWAAADRALADALSRSGVPVVGLDSRAYLKRRRGVDEAARDIARILDYYVGAWARDSVVLVGYSRGADILPFAINRLPPEIHRRLAGVALIGLGDHASFEFHWEDLVRDVRRSGDLPTRPEVERLRGLRVVCAYGEHERGSLCPALDSGLARLQIHGGDHMLSPRDAVGVVSALLRPPTNPGERSEAARESPRPRSARRR